LEPINVIKKISDEPSPSEMGYVERSEYREIIKTHANAIANLSNTTVNQSSAITTCSNVIDKQSDTIASQHCLIEVMVLDNKKDA
jgi:hypothetical protein